MCIMLAAQLTNKIYTHQIKLTQIKYICKYNKQSPQQSWFAWNIYMLEETKEKCSWNMTLCVMGVSTHQNEWFFSGCA